MNKLNDWLVDFPCKNDNNTKVILKKVGDREIYKGELFIDDYVFNGEDEVPIWLVKIDGKKELAYFTDFDSWARDS